MPSSSTGSSSCDVIDLTDLVSVQCVTTILVVAVAIPRLGALRVITARQLGNPVESAEEGRNLVRKVDQYVVAVPGFPVVGQQDGRLAVIFPDIDSMRQEATGPKRPQQVIQLQQLHGRFRVDIDLMSLLDGLFRQTAGEQGTCGLPGVPEYVEVYPGHRQTVLIAACTPVEQKLRQ